MTNNTSTKNTPPAIRHETTDWFGLAMDVRRELGDSPIAWFGQANAVTRKIQWHQIDHVEVDGSGGMARILRRLGHRIDKLSGDKKPEPQQGKFAIWRDFWRYVKQGNVQWNRPLDLNARTRPVPQYAWEIFTRDETRRITADALRQGASISTYLLAELNRIIARDLIKPGTDYFWMIPTNLRGALELPDDTANHCSYLKLRAQGDSTPTELQERQRDLLRRHHDWAFYWTIRFVGKHLGRRTLLKLTKKTDETKFICGCLTNIGNWQSSIPGVTPDPDEGWIVVPTVNKNNPVAAGTITWNGRLSIALDIHPALNVPFEKIQAIFDEWKTALLNGGSWKADNAALPHPAVIKSKAASGAQRVSA